MGEYARTAKYDAVRKGRLASPFIRPGDVLNFINEAFTHATTIGGANEGAELLPASQIQGAKRPVTSQGENSILSGGGASLEGAGRM